MARHPVAALAAALTLTVVLGGCSAMRDQAFGPPVDENGVAITQVVREAVAEVLPDADETHVGAHLDGFANTMTVTVRWPDEVPLDVTVVRDGARAICENVKGYDVVNFGFYLIGAERRADIQDTWSQAFPDLPPARDTAARIWEDDCPVVLA
ncbi:hypothetical protein J1G42_16680 [Cellulomonas sp. zg-ZUI222]|uniref:Lipoprotein n=1 Tax=Cellulomonas wangleii TaxID=2816956 RepID=A0ABX8D7S0_9CELL|nr:MULTISPECIES: hypothetical protein [Cellulomonas]MBO0901231.1 hypothetical protein [Cellulomonas sp. zg-ZUI22]MBO0922458.1 hypothetical protein [Cellulomonas wangleii]MBO0924899.1 hypothetical protein [Cellulomonas wangleii]QVI63063.1 hypothetical protein KG103_03845 [Cellulomonas wangleii]